MGRYEKIYKLDLPHRAIAVYYYLYDRANDKGECWPAIPTIAREINLSVSTVKRAIRDLKDSKLIETTPRYRTKGGNSSLLFRIL